MLLILMDGLGATKSGDASAYCIFLYFQKKG